MGVLGPTELHSTGDTFEDVFRSLGHTVVKMWPRSPVVGMERVVALIEEPSITALVCTPAAAISLARYMNESGLSPQQSPIKLILTLGELTTPSLLRNIGHVWEAEVYNCMYASQESSILAACKDDGSLYTVPLNNYYEIINPDTTKCLDLNVGEVIGELVITHLYKGQKPLIRYRTGDMVKATMMPDGSLKIIPLGRVRDTILLNTVNYSAWDIEAALLYKLTNCLDYYIQIDRKNNEDILNVVVELHDVDFSVSTRLSEVEDFMHAELHGVQVNISEGNTTELTNTSAMVSWKAARLHDMRPDSDNSDRDSAMKLLQKGFK